MLDQQSNGVLAVTLLTTCKPGESLEETDPCDYDSFIVYGAGFAYWPGPEKPITTHGIVLGDASAETESDLLCEIVNRGDEIDPERFVTYGGDTHDVTLLKYRLRAALTAPSLILTRFDDLLAVHKDALTRVHDRVGYAPRLPTLVERVGVEPKRTWMGNCVITRQDIPAFGRLHRNNDLRPWHVSSLRTFAEHRAKHILWVDCIMNGRGDALQSLPRRTTLDDAVPDWGMVIESHSGSRVV